MTALLLFALLFVVVIGWLKLRDQIKAVEARLHWSTKGDRDTQKRQTAELAARVFSLEQQFNSILQAPAGAAAKAGPIQPPLAAFEAPLQRIQEAPAEEPAPSFPSFSPAPSFAAPPSFAPAPPKPSWSDRLRQLIGDREWETLVAGSVMNKIGALLVVIGIALFLGYSFSRVNPAARATAAALISAGILAGGVVLERRLQYRVFSRGLIGAGWAALYTTAYAMYALPAAQIVSNPFFGSILLLAVSAGMIAHSLRYRAQAVTAVAYFTAFAALAVTPSTPFAVESLIPLAASLLYFAWRFEWYAMALFGLFATYATCISRGSSNAPLYATTSLFIIYWLLFESFDILRSRRGWRGAGLAWIFPLNTIAFLGLAYQAWSTQEPDELWRIAALSAVLFLSSAMLRILVHPPNTATVAADPFDCIRKGTYEPPLTIAAVLAGLAILGRVTGFWTNTALAFEAEIFYLAGLRFQSRFLRALGRSGFSASLCDVLATTSRDVSSVSILGISLHNWTPSVIVYALLFYFNRWVWGAISSFSFAATALVTLVTVAEVRPHIAPVALFAFALGLLELALRKRLIEFRIQSYFVASLAAMLVVSARGFAPHAPASIWGLSAASAVACWFFTARILFAHLEELRPRETAWVRDLFALAGSGFAMLTLWMLLPGALTAAAWTALALAWLAIASRLNLNSFLWIAAGILAMAYTRLLGVNLTTAWPSQNSAEQFIIPLFATAALYCFWHIFRRAPQALEKSFAPVFTWLAAVVLLWLLYLEVNRFYLASAWAALAIVFLAAGLRMNVSAFPAKLMSSQR